MAQRASNATQGVLLVMMSMNGQEYQAALIMEVLTHAQDVHGDFSSM